MFNYFFRKDRHFFLDKSFLNLYLPVGKINEKTFLFENQNMGTMLEKKNGIECMTDQKVRQRLLASAAALFARKGYASTTVREIVEAAHVTKPALYYYFRNKEEIYLELMRTAEARFETLLGSARKEFGAVKERILLFSEQIFQLFLDQIEIARVGISIHYGPAQGAPFFDFDAFHLKIQELIERLICEGIRKGGVSKRKCAGYDPGHSRGDQCGHRGPTLASRKVHRPGGISQGY